MPKLSDLLAEKANADIQVGSATVKVQFYVFWRERFADEEWQEVLTLTSNRETFKRVLPRVVLIWDLIDDEGHTVPVTAEAIDQHQIPDPLLSEIWRRVTGSDLSGKAISTPLPAT